MFVGVCLAQVFLLYRLQSREFEQQGHAFQTTTWREVGIWEKCVCVWSTLVSSFDPCPAHAFLNHILTSLMLCACPTHCLHYISPAFPLFPHSFTRPLSHRHKKWRTIYKTETLGVACFHGYLVYFNKNSVPHKEDKEVCFWLGVCLYVYVCLLENQASKHV